jgi:hypothetical protein
MMGSDGKRLAHGALGAFQGTIAIARNAEIHPGVDKVWRQLGGADEGRFRRCVLRLCEFDLTEHIVNLRQLGRAHPGSAGGTPRLAEFSKHQRGRGKIQKRRRVGRESALARFEMRYRFAMPSVCLEADGEMKLYRWIPRRQLMGLVQQAQRLARFVLMQSAQARDAQGARIRARRLDQRSQREGARAIVTGAIKGLGLENYDLAVVRRPVIVFHSSADS